jgi:hypothetical protein
MKKQNFMSLKEQTTSRWFSFCGEKCGKKPKFFGYYGPNPVISVESELDCFFLFFPLSLISHLATETTKKAWMLGDYSFITSVEEIIKYLVVLLIAGIVHVPSWRDYWSSSITGQTSIINLLSRDRWTEIHKYFHIDNPTKEQKKEDPLALIRTVYNELRKRFKQNWYLSEVVVVDEGIIPFKGKVMMRQYIPRKPHNTGIKYWAFADETGYLYDFKIYIGKMWKGVSDANLGEKIVLNFEKHLSPQSHILIFDNYFNSLSLAEKLIEKKRFFIGTCRADRPKWLFDEIKKDKNWNSKIAGSSAFLYQPDYNICATLWKDSGVVPLLSNYGNPSKIEIKKKKKKRGSNEEIELKIPEIASIYRKYYHAVDIFDKAHMTYRVHHKSYKWFHPVFWSLLKFAIVDAWIFWKFLKKVEIGQKEFIEKLIEQLTDGNLTKNRHFHQNQNHFPKKTEKRKRCSVCNENSSTNYYYEPCKSFLHPKCFYKWHLQLNK